jgi:hypothetical protein
MVQKICCNAPRRPWRGAVVKGAKKTSYNRSVYASPPVGGSGFRFARSAAPPTLHSTHILAGLQTYGLRIRPAKTSYTAGTLCEMGPKIFVRILEK